LTGQMDEGERLAGGADHGAVRYGGTVRRVAGPWTPAVHHPLTYLAERGFQGTPRPLAMRLDQEPPEAVLTYVEGESVGNRRPWPAWVHSDNALAQTGRWLAAYHRLVEQYRPPADAAWREVHAAPGPGVVIAHNDAAPYNAIWATDQLIGFIDWDMAGPRHRDDDLAWTAFSWVPLHAEHVVRAEGFTDLGRRRARLSAFLRSYGSELGTADVLSRLDDLLAAQVELMARRAGSGDETYRRMIDAGRSDDLAAARAQLRDI
jgi:hypothetical protein